MHWSSRERDERDFESDEEEEREERQREFTTYTDLRLNMGSIVCLIRAFWTCCKGFSPARASVPAVEISSNLASTRA